MPHDANGNLLKKGDRVTVEFEVREVWESADCNVTLDAIDPATNAKGQSGAMQHCMTGSAKLTAKVLAVAVLLLCMLAIPVEVSADHCSSGSCGPVRGAGRVLVERAPLRTGVSVLVNRDGPVRRVVRRGPVRSGRLGLLLPRNRI